MVEYKVETCSVGDAERLMNNLSKEGWTVKTVTPNIFKGHGLVITF